MVEALEVSPESDAKMGCLNLILIDALSPLKRLFNIPKVESGKHLSAPFVTQYKVDKVRLSHNHYACAL